MNKVHPQLFSQQGELVAYDKGVRMVLGTTRAEQDADGNVIIVATLFDSGAEISGIIPADLGDGDRLAPSALTDKENS